jgi:hypothetical protein
MPFFVSFVSRMNATTFHIAAMRGSLLLLLQQLLRKLLTGNCNSQKISDKVLQFSENLT